MPNVKEGILIGADRDTLWSLLTTPDSILQWYEGLDSLEATPDYPAIGSVMRWTYKVGGLEFKGTHTVRSITPGAVIGYQLDGLITGMETWRVSETQGGLRLDVENTYTMSGGVLGKLAEPVVHQMNLGNAKKSLATLKKMAEGR